MQKLWTLSCCLTAWVLMAGWVVSMAEARAGDWEIASKGETRGREEYTVTFAAGELGRCMSAVLGQKVNVAASLDKTKAPNVFFITEAKYAPKEIAKLLDGKRGDAFVIKYPYMLEGRKVCLMVSHDRRGYDFPVYYFLKHFMGCDWVGPGEIGKVIPHNPDWRMPEKISVMENPDFEMRFWSDSAFKHHARVLLAGSLRMDFHHAFGRIYAPAKYGKSDPDIYPLIEGKRMVPDPKMVATAGWQPCVGNPKVQDIAVAHVLEQYRRDPSTVSVSLSVNDGGCNDCMCKLCRAMDIKGAFDDPLNPKLSDRYFRFYNKVIERVLKKQPNARIAVLGYGPCGTPPLETKINDRICVFISTGANPRQFEKAGGSSALYHYHLDSAYPTIRHYPHMIARFLRESKAVGGIGYYAEIHHNWAAAGPKTYVLTQLLWDVNTDVDKALDEYMRACFGEEAMVPMRAYFDRWEEIWKREAATLKNPYDTIDGWNSDQLRKFRFVTQEDVRFLDASLATAAKASMTEDQRKRYDLFRTYYDWIRCSLVQVLAARDLRDERWLAVRSPDEIIDQVRQAHDLTSKFDSLWNETISKDRSGWLLSSDSGVLKAVARGRRYHNALLVGPIRAEVEDYLEGGIEKALKTISTRLIKERGKKEALAYWSAAFAKEPSLRQFIKPESDRLEGIRRKNLIVNGDFEKGAPGTLEPGNPPKLPGWWFYDRVGMVLGSKAVYDWSKKGGHSGGYAIGCGPGMYPGLRTFVKAAPGRYRFSFRYRTVNRKDPAEVSIFRLSDDVRVEDLTSAEKVRAITNEQYLKFLRRSWPPTGGKWQRVSQTFVLDKECGLSITLEPFYMKEGAWVWFDDVELVKLY